MFCLRCEKEVSPDGPYGPRFDDVWVLCVECAGENAEPTVDDVARWLLREIEYHDDGYDAQTAASAIRDRFGSEFVYSSASVSLGTHPKVKAAMYRLSDDRVVWDHAIRAWRMRVRGDKPGHAQYGRPR